MLIQKSLEFFYTDAEISEFHVMQKFLGYMISDAEFLIVFYELAKNQNHPHAVAIEDSKGVEKASLIIERFIGPDHPRMILLQYVYLGFVYSFFTAVFTWLPSRLNCNGEWHCV